jgi:hypothetical protein
MNEMMGARIFVVPCFDADFLDPRKKMTAGEQASAESIGYQFSAPTKRFSMLAPELSEHLEDPFYAISVQGKNWQIRGFSWSTAILFWKPKTKEVLLSTWRYWRSKENLALSMISLGVSEFSLVNRRWNEAFIHSSVSTISDECGRKQDILRAIDSFDVLCRRVPRDRNAEEALKQYVIQFLENNNAPEIVEWFGTARFPMQTNDAVSLYDILGLSDDQREMLSKLVMDRDVGVAPPNETIRLPHELLICRLAKVSFDTIHAPWEENEEVIAEDLILDDDWLETLEAQEEVDMESLKRFLAGLSPTIRRLDEDSGQWNELANLAEQFAQKLQTF